MDYAPGHGANFRGKDGQDFSSLIDAAISL